MTDERDYFKETLERFEPEIAHTDTSASNTSMAVSLKRIADSMEIIVRAIQRFSDPVAVSDWANKISDLVSKE